MFFTKPSQQREENQDPFVELKAKMNKRTKP